MDEENPQEETPQDEAPQEEIPQDETPKDELTEKKKDAKQSSIKEFAKKLNASMAVSVVVALVVGMVLGQVVLPGFGVGFIALPSPGVTPIDSTVDMDVLEENVQDYLQKVIRLQQPELDAKVTSIESYNQSFYIVNFDVFEADELLNNSTVFLTKDGLALIGYPPMMLDEPLQPVPPTDSPPEESVLIQDLMDDDPVTGSDSAPVVIIEFSDFECPYCARFYSDTLSLIESEYIDTGKVQMVYRDFPLDFHLQAIPAAIAAECANDQGKFWEFHDKLYENQSLLSEESFKEWAEELGLDTAEFDACFDSQKYLDEVGKDFSDGGAVGVSGTPAFFIGKRNGVAQKLVGAQPFSEFKKVIDSLLE